MVLDVEIVLLPGRNSETGDGFAKLLRIHVSIIHERVEVAQR